MWQYEAQLYYNENWQVLEERTITAGSPTMGDGWDAADMAVHVQWLWDVRYIDAPVLRWRDADADPQTGLEEVLYYANDANMNVTALVDATPGSQTLGQVVERYVYDPYGRATIYNADWSAPVTWAASRKNEVTYCGYRFDVESDLHQVRWRYYHTSVGAWASRDPAGYVDGMRLYTYSRARPTGWTDPMGLDPRRNHVPETPWEAERIEIDLQNDRMIEYQMSQGATLSEAQQNISEGRGWQPLDSDRATVLKAKAQRALRELKEECNKCPQLCDITLWRQWLDRLIAVHDHPAISTEILKKGVAPGAAAHFEMEHNRLTGKARGILRWQEHENFPHPSALSVHESTHALALAEGWPDFMDPDKQEHWAGAAETALWIFRLLCTTDAVLQRCEAGEPFTRTVSGRVLPTFMHASGQWRRLWRSIAYDWATVAGATLKGGKNVALTDASFTEFFTQSGLKLSCSWIRTKRASWPTAMFSGVFFPCPDNLPGPLK